MRPTKGRERWNEAFNEFEWLKDFAISLKNAGFTFNKTYPVIFEDEKPLMKVVGFSMEGALTVVVQGEKRHG